MVLIASTTAILAALRLLMVQENIQAYIIPAGDAHYTEFVAECHQRRAFISGFTGSTGTAIVTADYALVWTDGRYYLQAENELGPDWGLQKDGMLGVPSQSEWLVSNLTASSRVGVDPTLYTKGQWDAMASELGAGNLEIVSVAKNLVDEVWGTNRPPCSNEPIFDLEAKYSGKSTSVKVLEVRKEMENNGADVLVVTELDEVAWLLNLRGRDIPSSSTFFAYVILTQDKLDFYVNEAQVSQTVKNILLQNVPEILIKPYGNIFAELPALVTATTGKIWANRNANYALTNSAVVREDRLLTKITPIALMKAIKNTIEVEGYRQALIRDAAALCEFYAWLEDALDNNESVTEISAATKLTEIRRLRSELFFDISFDAISATGPNGAIIHYMPTPESDRALSTNELYLLDSGAHYYDGTTDITRTVHFGVPTPKEKEAYTRVLKGQIALVTATFPYKTVGHRLDSFARQALWSVGLEYNHGTGHGIGAFLNIHEGPFSIGSRYSADDPGLQENMFTSNEPGFYEDGEFGIRLENVVRVQNVSLSYNFQNRGFLGFEDLTFVPYQHKLIDFSLLTDEEIAYLNNYQEETRRLVGNYITSHPDFPAAANDWLIKETLPIGSEQGSTTDPPSTSDGTTDSLVGGASTYSKPTWISTICLSFMSFIIMFSCN